MYKCRINTIEFELKFAAARVKEIKEELEEIRADGDEDDLLDSLKLELKNTRSSKKKLFRKWKEVTDKELERRRNLDENVGKEKPVNF